MGHPVCSILDEISCAFPHRRRAGDFALINGRPLGLEPWTVAAAFADKLDWTTIPVADLDRHGNALAFLSDEALRFYLPAYLAAALCDGRPDAPVVDLLISGMSYRERESRPFGCETSWRRAVRRWSGLTASQVAAVTHVLEYLALEHQAPVCGVPGDVADPAVRINEALEAYWYPCMAGETFASLPGSRTVRDSSCRT